MTVPFESFPKIPRLKRDIVITEKIDGTNAQIVVPRRRRPASRRLPQPVDYPYELECTIR